MKTGRKGAMKGERDYGTNEKVVEINEKVTSKTRSLQVV